MNKITLMLLFALLTTHHNHIKPGIITNLGIAVIAAVIGIVGFQKYQESQKSGAEKVIEKGAEVLKDGAKKAGF